MASHTFSADGDYTVTLTVVDDGSASAASSQTFNVVDMTPNQSPTASFTASCTDLSCDFDADGSSDSDGTIIHYSWDFDDANSTTGETSSNNYASAGSYDVTLTVTDNEGETASSSQTVTATAPEQLIDDDITLSLSGTSVKRTKYVDLVWTNIIGDEVDIYRAKKRKTKKISTTNDGAYQDSFNGGGTYIYKVCQAGKTDICSPEKTIEF
jgi:PKD repeat protein